MRMIPTHGDLNRLQYAIARHFRTRRMQAMVEMTGLNPESTVLDVGGTLFNWDLIGFRPRLTLLNVHEGPGDLPDGVEWVVGDGRGLPFEDSSFDLCYSNSVIEHVGTYEDQMSFAREVRRVGRSYYVQTPNYWFPVEPHLLSPLFHWMPMPVRRAALRNATPWGLLSRPSKAACESFLRETRIMKYGELARAFPDANIMVERVAGWPKSFVAVSPDIQQP